MDVFLRTQLSGDPIAMASAVAIGGAKFSGKAVDWPDTKTEIFVAIHNASLSL
jgi:hypothetical protein